MVPLGYHQALKEFNQELNAADLRAGEHACQQRRVGGKVDARGVVGQAEAEGEENDDDKIKLERI